MLASAAAIVSITRLNVTMSAAPPPSVTGSNMRISRRIDRGNHVVRNATLALAAVGAGLDDGHEVTGARDPIDGVVLALQGVLPMWPSL